MSTKLLFKPIFSIDFDQDLIHTIQELVTKNFTTIFNDISSKSGSIPSDLKDSLDFYAEKGISLESFVNVGLHLYYLERSLVKATESSLHELIDYKFSSSDFQKIFSIIENWPQEKIALLSVYSVKKGTNEQRIIQLTNRIFKWLDSFIPTQKKHEYKIFDDAFHNASFLAHEDSLVSEFGLQSKKKIFLRDQTTKIVAFEKNLLDNISKNKLSVVKADFSSFEMKQFFYFFVQKLLSKQKKVLWNKLDFFKQQFTELFSDLSIVCIIKLDFTSFDEQYEILSSLRNTPSIVILSDDSWEKFEQMKVFTNEIDILYYPEKDLSDKSDKEYLKSFCLNYIENFGLNASSMKLNDICSAIVKNSSCSVSYIEAAISYVSTLDIDTINQSFLNDFPSSETELFAFEFKNKFMDLNSGKNLLKTFVGLSTIQSSFNISFFTKNQLIGFYSSVLQKNGDASELKTKDVEQLLGYFTKIGNLYSFSSHTIIKSLLFPNKVFDDEKVENFSSKKLFLTIQNFITDLPDLRNTELFTDLLLSLIQTNDILDMELSLLYLITIDSDFNKKLENIDFSREKLFSLIKTARQNESNIVKKSFTESTDYFLYMLESLFDRYLVKGMYETSKNILAFLDAMNELVDVQYKVRFKFQKARQLIANGNLNQSYEELMNGIVLAKQIKDYWLLVILLRLLGETYFINQQPLFGNYSFDQILTMHSRIIPDKTKFKAYTLVKLSDRLNEIGLFAFSLQSIEEAVDIFHTKKVLLEKVNAQQKMTDLLFKLGSTDLAITELQDAITSLGDLDDSFTKRLESIKNAFENPVVYHPLYSFKNWQKINYLKTDTLKIQEERYEKSFLDIREKELTEESIQQIIYYIRLLFKLGKIHQLRLVLDYLERHIPVNSQNKGLVYLELSLLHNFMANVDIANYYSDLARTTLFSIPVEFEISIKYQLNYIGFQLYTNRFELAEMLLQAQFLRKRRKNEAELYWYYAFLETKKNPPNDFEKFYEKGKGLKIEKSEQLKSKQDIRSYGSGILYNQYSTVFPMTDISKKDIEIIEEINWLFYAITIDANTGQFSIAFQKLAKVEELIKGLTAKEWKEDFTISHLKKLGQLYYNDKSDPENPKKSIFYWQNALKKIVEVTKDEPQLYLFERLDLLYLIGKSAVKFGLLESNEANKYLVSGKNLIKKFNIHNSLQLEFQFDSALGTNYFDAKDYSQAVKYYTRALTKHDNKLYAELQLILLNLVSSYQELDDKDALKQVIVKYKEYIRIFGIQPELEKKGLEKSLFE